MEKKGTIGLVSAMVLCIILLLVVSRGIRKTEQTSSVNASEIRREVKPLKKTKMTKEKKKTAWAWVKEYGYIMLPLLLICVVYFLFAPYIKLKFAQKMMWDAYGKMMEAGGRSGELTEEYIKHDKMFRKARDVNYYKAKEAYENWWLKPLITWLEEKLKGVSSYW